MAAHVRLSPYSIAMRYNVKAFLLFFKKLRSTSETISSSLSTESVAGLHRRKLALKTYRLEYLG
jgi:hypothetical protein